MRIGYFGGSFDPPHRGHLAVARAARDAFALDRLLLAPTARQPFKPNGPEASFADRLRMTELLCAGEWGLEVSALDGPQPDGVPNYTVDTLRRLLATLAGSSDALDHPRRGSASPPSPPHLFAILGADAFLHFPGWREPHELLRLAEWIIVSRPGIAAPALDAYPPAERSRLHFLNDVADPLSATALRERLHKGENCADIIPAPVLRFIHERGLYGAPALSPS